MDTVYREISDRIKFAVDIPQWLPEYKEEDSEREWMCVDYFETREEALKFAQENFGADENGMVCLISNM